MNFEYCEDCQRLGAILAKKSWPKPRARIVQVDDGISSEQIEILIELIEAGVEIGGGDKKSSGVVTKSAWEFNATGDNPRWGDTASSTDLGDIGDLEFDIEEFRPDAETLARREVIHG